MVSISITSVSVVDISSISRMPDFMQCCRLFQVAKNGIIRYNIIEISDKEEPQ